MSFLLLRRCCCCVDLRSGSFLIGYLMLILRLLTLVMTSVRLAHTDGIMHHAVGIVREDLAFHRLIGIIALMVLIFEILLNFALVYGLHKGLDQHVEMYYVGSFFFLVCGIIMYSVVMMRYGKLFGAWAWVFVVIDILLKLVMVYFLAVIRSYYFRMKDEQKEDVEQLEVRQNGKTFFERTQPVLFSSKP